MQVVIDISEKDFIEIFINGIENNEKIINLIRKGTPLPKCHGRLIDADALTLMIMVTDDEILEVILKEDIDNAPTIIEASNESEVDE